MCNEATAVQFNEHMDSAQAAIIQTAMGSTPPLEARVLHLEGNDRACLPLSMPQPGTGNP
jgi:hypothetical protein